MVAIGNYETNFDCQPCYCLDWEWCRNLKYFTFNCIETIEKSRHKNIYFFNQMLNTVTSNVVYILFWIIVAFMTVVQKLAQPNNFHGIMGWKCIVCYAFMEISNYLPSIICQWFDWPRITNVTTMNLVSVLKSKSTLTNLRHWVAPKFCKSISLLVGIVSGNDVYKVQWLFS